MDPRVTKGSDLLGELAADLLACLRFCTRLPFPSFAFEEAPYDTSLSAHAHMLPLAGAFIGTIAAIVLLLGIKLGLPPSLVMLCSITSLIILTGALHEDGLADFADAMGGTTPERRLAIMKDSQHGTFGVLALILDVLARVLSLWFIVRHNFILAGTLLIATAAVSRTLALLPLYLLPPARAEGSGFSAGAPQRSVLAFAGLGAFIFGLLPLLAGAGFGQVLIGLLLSTAAAYGVTMLAKWLLGGQTGDVAGAAQQLAEIAAYFVFASWLLSPL